MFLSIRIFNEDVQWGCVCVAFSERSKSLVFYRNYVCSLALEVIFLKSLIFDLVTWHELNLPHNTGYHIDVARRR